MKNPKNKVKVIFESSNAAESVTGSCTLIDLGECKEKILVECGLIQENRSLLQEYQANAKKFSFKPKEISYVFVGHSHIDHIGSIPKLVRQGFSGKIIVPKGNKRLMKELLLDSMHIMEKDANDLSKRLGKDYPPIYSSSDVYESLKLVEEYDFNQKYKLNEFLEFEFLESGHIINSAQIVLWIKSNNSIKKIGFTSDLGNVSMPSYYINEFEPIKSANLLVGECTYCNKERSSKTKDRKKDLEKIKSALLDTLEDRQGSVLFPVFALHRLEVMLTVLYEIFKDDQSFNYPIYISSPLGKKIAELFKEDLRSEEQIALWEEVLEWKNVVFLKSFEELQGKIKEDQPSIYLSPAGMCNSGHAVYILEKLLPKTKNTIIFCGYSAQGTIAAKIKNGKQKTITVNGVSVPNKANVVNLSSFSSHMPYSKLLWYYSSFDFDKIALVHGNFDDKVKFTKTVEEEKSKKNKSGKVICVNKSTIISL